MIRQIRGWVATDRVRRTMSVLVGLAVLLLAFGAMAQDAPKDPFGGDVEYRTLWDPGTTLGDWLNPRNIVWILAQLHLLFAAFVLAVPMFVLIIEIIGARQTDPAEAKRYDGLAYEFCKLLTTAFSTTAVLGAIFTFVCVGMYPRLFGYLAEVFGPTMYLYSTIFFGEAYCLYLYYYGWGKFPKKVHILIGVGLNVFGVTLMLIANAWTTFMMAPAGLEVDGSVVDRSAAFWNFLLHPINIHRLIANLCMGGSVAAAYAAYRWLTTDDPELKARYDWMGYIGNFIAILALLPLPFAGYYLGYEIYMFNQQLGIYMMGGILSWLFVLQAVLIGALFFAANYYLWLAMDRIEGSERFRPWIKFLLGVITVGILVWATPKSLILTSAEIDAMGGTNHPILSLLGVMSAKNTAVNLIILATFLSFLLYKNGNKVSTVSWAKAGYAWQGLCFGVATAVVLVIGVGGYIPGWWMESTKRVAMSPWQVVAVILCVIAVIPVDWAMMRNAKVIGKIRWGQVSRRSQYTLFFLAVSFTWLMALMGFVRSSLRQHWHVYEVMKDTSPWAYTPTIGYATVIVTVVVILFFLLVGMVVAFASLGSLKPASERAPLPARTKLIRTFAAIALLVGCGVGLGQLEGHKKADKDAALVAAESRDEAMTTKFDVIDPEKGVYQAPVDSAIAMLAGNPELLEPTVAPGLDLDEMSPMERGQFLFEQTYGCGACHSVDGSVKQAPTLMGRWGSNTRLEGSEVPFDDAYFEESLFEPEAKYAAGYDPNANASASKMTSFAGKVNAQQLSDLITYLKSL